MNINTAFPSKYLKASDADEDLLLTIKSVKLETIGQEPRQELKPVVYFSDADKGLVLNKTNAKMIEKIAGTPDTDEWKGVKVRLIATEVEFQGDLVMSLRVRDVKRVSTKTAAHVKPDPVHDAPHDDDIPF